MNSAPRENPIIALAVSRPVAMLMVTTAVVVFGAICLSRLPLDLMPELDYPSVTVRTEYPGAAPEDVEDRVSRRLEQALSVVKGVRRISSISRAEQGDVVLEFAWNADMKAAVQDVREKLDQTFLPDQAETPTILRYDPSLDPILQIGLTGPRPERELRLIAEDEIERRLETVQGVAAVKVRGGREREIRVEVREEAAQQRGVTIAEITRRLQEENLDQVSGLLSEGNVTYVVRTRNEFQSIAEIEQIPIRREGESFLRLGELARVVETVEKPEIITRIDGNPAVKIEIYREAGANIVNLSRRVREKLYGTEDEQDRFKRWTAQRMASPSDVPVADEPGTAPESERKEKVVLSRPEYVLAHLPAGCRVDLLSDQSVFIEGAITDLQYTAILGGILAILVLFAFLKRFAFTAVVAVSIPLSVVATFAPLYLGEISLNIMSLGGLALGVGMLVDSSIVVLESIFRRREDGEDPTRAAIRGASDVSGAVVASTLTTIAVFFPIVFVEGMAAQFFRDQALTVVFALIASLLVSLTLIPMLAARLPDPKKEDRARSSYRDYFWPARFKGSWQAFVARRWYVWPLALPYLLVELTLEALSRLIFAAMLLVALSIKAVAAGVGKLGAWISSVPLHLFEVGFRAVERGYRSLLGASLSHGGIVVGGMVLSIVAAGFAYRELGSELIPEVAQGEFVVHVKYPVGTRIELTSAEVGRYEAKIAKVQGIESVATTVGVDSEDVTSADEGSHTARIRVRLRRSEESLADQESRVRREILAIFSDAADREVDFSRPSLFSFSAPLEVEVRGYDLAQLAEISAKVEAVLASVPGLEDVRSSVARGNPEYHLFPDRDRLARYGVTSAELAEVLRQKNMGEVATQFRDNEEKIDVRVQLAEEDRDSINKLLSAQVKPGEARASGWSLDDLLREVSEREGPAEIRRVNQQRATVLTATLAGIDLGTTSERVEQAIYKAMPNLPPEIAIEVVGQKKEMDRSRSSLIGALLLAIFLVYVVMASQFESLVQPFVILFTIPLAAVGVTVTLWLTGTSLSITAFIGMILLAGIVVNNAIVLIDQVNRQRQEGKRVRSALIEGGLRRLRPICMTTLTTMLAMVPLTGVLAAIPHGPGLDFLLGSGQGAEIRAPMAYTVIGGLFTSTILTLVVIPVVYSWVVRDPKPSPSQEGSLGEAGVGHG